MELACCGGLPLNSFYTLGLAQHTCGFHAGLKSGTTRVVSCRATGAREGAQVKVIGGTGCGAGCNGCEQVSQDVVGGTPSDFPPSMPIDVPVIIAD